MATFPRRRGEDPLLESEGGGFGGTTTSGVSPFRGSGGFGSLMGKIKDKAEVFMRPKVQNSIYPEISDGKLSGKYAQRNVRGEEEIKAIKESGYMLPKEGGKKQKYFTQTDNVNTNVSEGTSVLRVPIEKVPANRAVSKKDVEKYNPDSGKFEALSKGGLVKKKSHPFNAVYMGKDKRK
jgi:hypothetical protein